MSRKTLEEIEAVHAARAARKQGSSSLESTPQEELVDPSEDVQNPDEHPGDQPVDLEAELSKLRQQYSALQGRLTPAQQQLEEYRRLYDSERASRESETQRLQQELEELRNQMDERQSDFDPADLLTEEERELFDDETINLVTKVAKAAAKAAAPRVDVRAEIERTQQELAQQKINDYRTQVINDPGKGLIELQHLAHDPEFNAWLEVEGNEDVEPLVRALFQAQTQREIDRMGRAVAKRIAAYTGSAPQASPQRQTTDARTSLERAAKRRPRILSDEEMSRKLHEAKQLARSRNPEDRKRAEQIINSL